MTEMTAYEREWRAKGVKGDIYEPRPAPIPKQRSFRECQVSCEHLNNENAIGGEARAIVHAVGKVLGVDLTEDVRGHIWSQQNMNRVLVAARQVALSRRDWQAETDKLRAELEKAKPVLEFHDLAMRVAADMVKRGVKGS